MTLIDVTTTSTNITGSDATDFVLSDTESSSSQWLSFHGQGQILAGKFFQISLMPYLMFLYFLGFRGNKIPALSYFGFQFVLLFVLITIPAGIITKSAYGLSLSNTDYLHGGAESQLTYVLLGNTGSKLEEPRLAEFSLFCLLY